MRFKIQKNDVVEFTEKTPYLGCFGQVVMLFMKLQGGYHRTQNKRSHRRFKISIQNE